MAVFSIRRAFAVARKEFLHILRDPQTLGFTLVFPLMELFLLGYAIDMNVRHVPTVVVDHAGTQESRALLQRFENSQTLKIVRRAFSDREANDLLVSGVAHVGVIIPQDYSRQIESGETAQVLMLVDGSVSSVASEALNVGNALALQESLARILGERSLPVEARPRVLFNPDTRSPNFFIPGLMVILCQMLACMLAANALVREKEIGTLEQLYMTPVGRSELVLGKLLPYLVMTVGEFCLIAGLMRLGFAVPIHGAFLTLLIISIPFIVAMIALGLLISTKAETRDAAGQMVMGTMLPSIFLSGYVFPLETLPPALVWFARCLPTTWLIDASRGVILRGAGWQELWPNAVILWGIALLMLVACGLRVRRTAG